MPNTNVLYGYPNSAYSLNVCLKLRLHCARLEKGIYVIEITHVHSQMNATIILIVYVVYVYVYVYVYNKLFTVNFTFPQYLYSLSSWSYEAHCLSLVNRTPANVRQFLCKYT